MVKFAEMNFVYKIFGAGKPAGVRYSDAVLLPPAPPIYPAVKA